MLLTRVPQPLPPLNVPKCSTRMHIVRLPPQHACATPAQTLNYPSKALCRAGAGHLAPLLVKQQASQSLMGAKIGSSPVHGR